MASVLPAKNTLNYNFRGFKKNFKIGSVALFILSNIDKHDKAQLLKISVHRVQC